MDERHKEKNIHFIGASEKVDMMKLVEMAISDIRQCQRYNFMGLWQNLTTLTKSRMRQTLFFQGRIYLI